MDCDQCVPMENILIFIEHPSFKWYPGSWMATFFFKKFILKLEKILKEKCLSISVALKVGESTVLKKMA